VDGAESLTPLTAPKRLCHLPLPISHTVGIAPPSRDCTRQRQKTEKEVRKRLSPRTFLAPRGLLSRAAQLAGTAPAAAGATIERSFTAGVRLWVTPQCHLPGPHLPAYRDLHLTYDIPLSSHWPPLFPAVVVVARREADANTHSWDTAAAWGCLWELFARPLYTAQTTLSS
jgi:hypothetical protein